MTDYSGAAQTALYALLTGVSPALASGGVHDRVPQSVTFPYVLIAKVDDIPDDTTSGNGIRTTYDLHVFSEYRGAKEALGIMSAIYDLLHRQSLTVTGRSSALSWVRRTRGPFLEPDGLRRHGVVTVEIIHR